MPSPSSSESLQSLTPSLSESKSLPSSTPSSSSSMSSSEGCRRCPRRRRSRRRRRHRRRPCRPDRRRRHRPRRRRLLGFLVGGGGSSFLPAARAPPRRSSSSPILVVDDLVRALRVRLREEIEAVAWPARREPSPRMRAQAARGTRQPWKAWSGRTPQSPRVAACERAASPHIGIPQPDPRPVPPSEPPRTGMKILLWHGYLLGGTGSNVHARARASGAARATR